MEEKKKPNVTLKDLISDTAINSFFGFYLVYIWLGTDSSKTDLSNAFGIEFFAITKALVLLASMFCGILGGYRLFKILIKLKKSVKFIDVSEDEDK